MRSITLGTSFGIIAALGVMAYVRLAPSDATWHVSPAAITVAGVPNRWLVAEGGDAAPVMVDMAAEAVAIRMAAIAQATPRTERLAGGGLHTTWITRSAIFGYPDYTTVLIVPDGARSLVLVYARSRFGVSDFGVNRARVESWLKQLQATQSAQP